MSARGFLAALALASLAVTACTPGVQPLLDEYNALFGNVTDRGQVSLENPYDWLKDHIDVPVIGNTLDLIAPAGGEGYAWKMEPDVKFSEAPSQLPDGFVMANYLVDSGQRFVMNVKKAGFVAGSRYILTCTFKKNGQEISDRCTVSFIR